MLKPLVCYGHTNGSLKTFVFLKVEDEPGEPEQEGLNETAQLGTRLCIQGWQNLPGRLHFIAHEKCSRGSCWRS